MLFDPRQTFAAFRPGQTFGVLMFDDVFVPFSLPTWISALCANRNGKIPGIMINFFALGLFREFLFRSGALSAKPIAWYLYAVSLYPLCMFAFEDVYFSSPGFWALFWMPPVLHWLGKLMLKGPRKQAQVC